MTPPDRGRPRFAPVGNRVAFDGGGNLYVFEPDAAASSRLTFEGQNFFPTWSPDGSEIAFTSKRSGSQDFDVYRRRSDGRGAAERLTNRPLAQGPRVWMKDGRLLVVEVGAQTKYDLDILDTAGTLTPYLANPWNESSPALSPDSRWVAYVSDESGPEEVYVSAFPEAGGRWQVSEGGGSDPYWDGDGTIYYLHDADLWAARVRTSPSVVVQDRRMVLAGPFVGGGRSTNMDREPHGGRYALVRARVSDTPTQLTVVTNWLDELRQRLSR
jgi:Tol biopolymer transport system component